MSYELFEKAAAINSSFDVIPTKTSILARGIVIDNNHKKIKKTQTRNIKMIITVAHTKGGVAK